MPQESSFQLPDPPQFPPAVLARFPEMRQFQDENTRWLNRIAFTLRQEFDSLRDRVGALEDAAD